MLLLLVLFCCGSLQTLCLSLSAQFIISLGHSSKVFPECRLPYLSRCWIVHQFFVAWYCFSCDWVHHWASKVFKHCWEHLGLFVHQRLWGVHRVQRHLFLHCENINCLLCHKPLPSPSWDGRVRLWRLHWYCIPFWSPWWAIFDESDFWKQRLDWPNQWWHRYYPRWVIPCDLPVESCCLF